MSSCSGCTERRPGLMSTNGPLEALVLKQSGISYMVRLLVFYFKAHTAHLFSFKVFCTSNTLCPPALLISISLYSMGSVNLVVIVESARSLITSDDELQAFHLPSIIAVAAALGQFLWLYLRRSVEHTLKPSNLFSSCIVTPFGRGQVKFKFCGKTIETICG